MKAKLARLKPKVIKYRCYKHFNEEKFFADLGAIPFHIATVFDWARNKLLSNTIERHAPLKQYILFVTIKCRL